MRYYSTNKQESGVSLEDAVVKGLAADKGLYMPDRIKTLPESFYADMDRLSFQEIAYRVADAFFGEDIPADTLKDIVYDTLQFDTPLVPVSEHIWSLELFHGPTLAFKDVGARFMARLLGYFIRKEGKKQVNVLVATSGDTGSAVANGFLGVEGIHVYVLYPKGKVSEIQEKQFTTLGRNITAIEVDGTFDDCQALVKSAFMDKELNAHMQLTSANSINVARFLPQAFYYFYAYAQLKREGKADKVVICVPSGNFGNITAGLFGKRMGLPVRRFIAANNRNDVFYQYLQTGVYTPRPSIATIANAMDVGADRCLHAPSFHRHHRQRHGRRRAEQLCPCARPLRRKPRGHPRRHQRCHLYGRTDSRHHAADVAAASVSGPSRRMRLSCLGRRTASGRRRHLPGDRPSRQVQGHGGAHYRRANCHTRQAASLHAGREAKRASAERLCRLQTLFINPLNT